MVTCTAMQSTRASPSCLAIIMSARRHATFENQDTWHAWVAAQGMTEGAAWTTTAAPTAASARPQGPSPATAAVLATQVFTKAIPLRQHDHSHASTSLVSTGSLP